MISYPANDKIDVDASGSGEETPPVVQTVRLEKTFLLGSNAVAALRGVNLSVTEGEWVAIMGPSGCGKTTLLNMLGLLDQPSAGSVLIDGQPTSQLSENRQADLRRDRLGYVFQFYSLVPMLTALENVMVPLQIAGRSGGAAKRRAEELLEQMGVLDRAGHLPSEMSGGQQQRVAIARALANEPRLVLLDEPTGDLDQESSGEMLNLLQGLNRDRQVTLVMVTHDLSVARSAGRVIHMLDGRVIAEETRQSDGSYAPTGASDRVTSDHPSVNQSDRKSVV